jgi:hypothetical protein
MEFKNWWFDNLGKHKGHHYDDVRYGYEAREEEIQKLKDTLVKLKELLRETADTCLAASIDPSVNYTRQMYRKELYQNAHDYLRTLKDEN